MSIKILSGTTEFPLSKIGEIAGVCWGSDISNKEKNVKRAMECIESRHGRVLEFVEIEMVIEGYSARVMREFERHHIGASFLQESTRYVDCNNFEFTTPSSFKNAGVEEAYKAAMHSIAEHYRIFVESGISKEDAAMILPLGMSTKIVDKRNLRSLIEMSRQRECSRAYWEYRKLFSEIKKELSSISDEWKWIVDTKFHPKCKELGYCPEKQTCGRN